MTRYMLDTNICIYAIKHKPEQVLKHLQKHNPEEICISSISYSELMYGVEKSKAKEKNRLALTVLLSNIEILPFDAKAGEAYGKVRADLETEGEPIGAMDMLIAGHALSLGYILVSNNLREFKRLKGLKTANWAE